MTNKEKYKQAFSAIHASDNFYWEAEKMEKAKKRHTFKTLVALVAICVLLVGGATTAYAMDLGGIQRTIQLWIEGDQTEAIIQFDGDGNYNMQYSDSEGEVVQEGGGGVAFGPDGAERPLSEEELMEQLSSPDVRYEDDGSVWVYWFDQKVDITERFENDICYVQLVNEKETLYLTIKYQMGHSLSRTKYPDPSSFN